MKSYTTQLKESYGVSKLGLGCALAGVGGVVYGLTHRNPESIALGIGGAIGGFGIAYFGRTVRVEIVEERELKRDSLEKRVEHDDR